MIKSSIFHICISLLSFSCFGQIDTTGYSTAPNDSMIYGMIQLDTSKIEPRRPLIMEDTVYKPGIYRTFEELKYNSPSIPFDYEVKEITRRVHFRRIYRYKMLMYRKEAKTYGRVLGFSDGKNVYIDAKRLTLSASSQFSKVEFGGRYAYFDDVDCITYSEQTNCYVYDKVMDMHSGFVHVIAED